jgi:hypothetical protein
MLFKMLNLLGLDVAAKIEAARESLEQRVERASDRIKRVAEDTAVIATLGVFATVTATMALIVGLIALYRLVAQAYGDYAGLGAAAALLILMTAALAAVIFAKARKLSSVTISGSLASGIPGSSRPSSVKQPVAMPMAAPPDDFILQVRPPAAPRDLIDPLALVLSEVIEVPKLGNAVVDDLIGKISTTARSSVDEAVYGAANTIRHGRPADLILVLTSTAAVAWLITRNARLRS